jgi:hypothetical protein
MARATRSIWAELIGLAVLGIVLAASPVHAAGVCGNGVVEGGEECDPGGALHCDGNPSEAACTTGAQCNGGINCYFEFSCCKFNCQFVGQGASCFDGNQCTDGDHCDNVGRCVGQFKADGAACDDAVFCNGPDSCQTGDCAGHAGDPCAAATDCQTTCNETTDSCESTPFVPCGDDGNTCTDDVCNGTGTCTHPPLPGGTVCRPAATGCDVAETCAGGGAPCPANGFMPNGTSCGDVCTTNGTCQTGVCTGGTPLVCDDNNACNGVETCTPFVGCQPGTPLDCVDGNSCTADQCNPSGGCSNPDLADGSTCDDGNLCTIIDRCQGGVCQGEDLTFFARTSAKLSTAAFVDGHLAVNEPGGSAKLGSFSVMPAGSLLTADRVGLGKLASVWDIETNLLRAPAATIGGNVTPATLPVLPAWCPMPAGACGGPNVLVGERQVTRITPGAYGTITVLSRGTLELDPGEYDLCGIRTSSPTAIRPRGNVVVRLQGDLKIGRFGLIEPYAGSAQIWVAGKGKILTSSGVHAAAINTPDSTLKLGRFVDFEGALCADSLKGSRSVRLGCPLLP